MEPLNIEKFSPKKAELQALVLESQALTLPDPKDKEQVKKIKEARLKLRTARTTITKAGKEWRDEAIAFQRAVVAKEKELVAIVEPEEVRLEGLEAEAKQVQDREDRREFLPRRIERLATLADSIEISEAELLDMDGTAFEAYFNWRSADKNDKDRQANAEAQRKIDAEATKLAHDKALVEAEARGRIEAEDRAKREIDAKARREAEDREAEAEQKRIAKADQEADERYQAFLKDHGYNSQDFYTTQDVGGVITLWKKVATYDSNEHGPAQL